MLHPPTHQPCPSIESCHLSGPVRELDPPLLAPVAPEPERDNRGMWIGLAAATLMVAMLVISLIYVINHPSEAHHIQRCY